MASLPRISATDSRYKVDVYINKCYDAARSLFYKLPYLFILHCTIFVRFASYFGGRNTKTRYWADGFKRAQL